MSSLTTWAVLVASLATSDCRYRPPDLSWAEIKELAPFWRPRIPSPHHRARYASRVESPTRSTHPTVAHINPLSTGPAAAIAPLNAPHKPTPDYGSPEWHREEAHNRARERAIDRTIKHGMPRLLGFGVPTCKRWPSRLTLKFNSIRGAAAHSISCAEMRRRNGSLVMSHSFRRLLPVLLSIGSMVAPVEALAGSIKRNSEWVGSAYRYGPAYVGQPAAPYYSPYYYPGERGRRQDLHLYLNAPGNTVRILDGGKQIVVYDRECKIHHEVVPSRRGPHPITVTRC